MLAKRVPRWNALRRLCLLGAGLSVSTSSFCVSQSTSNHRSDDPRRSPKKVLVVGGGLTGALVAHALSGDRQSPPHGSEQAEATKAGGAMVMTNGQRSDVQVWEAAADIGGRMRTVFAPISEGEEEGSQPLESHVVPRAMADLGAQYVSARSELSNWYINSLRQAGLLQPLTAVIDGGRKTGDDFVAPLGMTSLVRHFMPQVPVLTRKQVIELNTMPNGRLQAVAADGHAEEFDAVVLTIPPPQVAHIRGTALEDIDAQTRHGLQEVRYSSRHALALFFAPGTHIPSTWAARYVRDNDCVRFLALDSKLKQNSADVSLVVHTAVPWSILHMGQTPAEVEELILRQVQQLMPSLPKPTSTQLVTWEQSQVSNPFLGGKAGYVVLRPATGAGTGVLLAGGDGFTSSNVDGCVRAAACLSSAVDAALYGGRNDLDP